MLRAGWWESSFAEKGLGVPVDKFNLSQQWVFAAMTANILGCSRKNIARLRRDPYTLVRSSEARLSSKERSLL